MPADADDSTNITATGGVLVPPAEVVRSSADRERRLTEYIRAHTGADISVRLTPHIPTACVIPTSEEALIESDNADFTDEQARQLVAAVEADYLVLISTRPAVIDNLPITDQLTADRAQQFGYALHELGHIRYTAIADAAALLEDRVDEEYQEFVHGLWNSCEDAAIENQLALDQSQLAADRLELVNRSVSTHAEDLPADNSAQFTFRDALEAALYDTGIYDTEVRDVLCDPDDDHATFASDADRQAFEQIEASINEIVATVLSTPDSLGRADRVFAWWETDIKPLLDPSCRDEENSDQPTSNSVSDESTADAENDSSNRSPPEGTGSDEYASESGDEQQREQAANDVNASGMSDSSEGDERDTTGTQDEIGETVEGGEQAEHSETATPASEAAPRPGPLPDPDEINTDQHQSIPGSDALEYPDLGDAEDATALSDLRSETGTDEEDGGVSKPAERSHTQSSADASDSTQPGENRGIGDEKSDDSENDTADDDGAPGRTESSRVAEDHETADTSSDFDANSDFENETQNDTAAGEDDSSPQSGTAGIGNGEADQKTAPDASSEDATETGGENSGQTDEPTTDDGQTENPWKTGDSTNQTSLGSFSGTAGQVENGAGGSDEGATDERSNESSHAEQDDQATGSEDRSAPELEVKSGDSNPADDLGDGTAPEGDSIKGDSTGSESDPHAESIEKEETIESATENEWADQDEDVSATKSDSDDERSEHERPESSSEPNKKRPEPTPIHANGDGGLEREGTLDTDRDAAHDEADRKTPDERALECDLDGVADALEVLDGQDRGSDAAPGSISELAIMPDRVGSNALGVDQRWREATADSEFVADALRKALRESRRDAHRSGITSGTFDRQRAGALARGDVGAFRVPQFGEEKQYDLVILLDRSRSMRRHIEIAEDALVRFALACEDIGINVCVIDLYLDEARLVKPFSVECEHVRECVFSRVTSGGTPLADALGLGHELLEQRRNSPLVLVVTDGKPGSPDAYEEELAQSYAPVCGLTLVLDDPEGSVPDRVARNERFYDRHVYVHDPSQLADRLDQFAVMFSGL